MFDYELHQFRTAELAAQAARHGLVREALKAAKTRRALGREAAEARLTARRTEPTARQTDRYTHAA
ncbi:hypothetical protein [Streptomyces sp. NRRL B-1347]|uniref:hypothetical protein n=1 Tax=Streptomyces sp. NRRL B-1347 TaxID=1476877 RepID=UPI0004C9DC33|nr:hypothetical protein [Streptomyces sp. NRRL B-1347]